MPRTSYQVFTDLNTKVIAGYEEGTVASGSGSSSTKVVTEKVINRHGSSAGASSGEFHMYLDARKRERERIQLIELNDKAEEEKSRFAAKVEQNKKESLERTKRNAAKRKRLKEKKIARKKATKMNPSNNPDANKNSDDAIDESDYEEPENDDVDGDKLNENTSETSN